MIRALAVLANGGVAVQPHIVKEIDYKLGNSKLISHPEGKRVLKEETAKEVTEMLIKVVDTALS